MKRFGGFPPRMRFTAIPEPFFSHLLPGMDDIAELKIVLAVFHLLYHKKGYPRFVTHGELLNVPGLLNSLAPDFESSKEVLKSALEKAVDRGIILRLDVTRGDAKDDVYLLNSETEREVVARVQSGEISLPGVKVTDQVQVPRQEKVPDVFTLYEENIGMITPVIADEIREAQKMYPEAWLHDAIREAANQNKRKWSYISAILERWGSEGKADGTYRRDSKKTDPDKYIKGKYGHMVKR